MLNVTCGCLLYFSWWQHRNFRVPSGSTTMKSATAGKAFGFWNNKDNTFQFKLPPGTCKAEISFMGVTGIHEFYFSKITSEASHVSWEDYDYEYKSEAYMLDREFTKCGRHPPIVERPIPRVENMAEFYNPLIHLTLQMDHWLEKGEYTPPMNCDLLGELVAPWV